MRNRAIPPGMERKTCTVCGDIFEWEQSPNGGKPATRCLKCRRPQHSKNRPHDLQAASERRALRRTAGRDLVDQARQSKDFSLARRIAWYLDKHPHPQDAAKAAGLGDVEGLAEIVAIAREHFPDLVKRENLALAELLTEAMFRQAVNLIDNSHAVAPGLSATAIRSLAQAREALVGAGQANDYAQIQVVIRAPDGSEYDVIEGSLDLGEPN